MGEQDKNRKLHPPAFARAGFKDLKVFEELKVLVEG